ncbi:DNA invertase Pin-like site-specific DNA recombinase [Flavobacterium araucananum]|uniref:Transposase n=1 Tax=Flavobacterium araucananum TaxID=946678 RepID=A0A227PIK9_9FLAO|nr:recombinase family protein [Flavobacterium araucananum]OXG09224.1 transposase [Flavobacterium araucananum]PWK02582.1 DNA invertase Pin-like site-specific DNA recombinase [Flavobacterium araucananum]
MSKVKYIRVSTEEQNTGRQEVNAKEFSKIYIDKTSGAIQFIERKEAKKLLADIETGIVTEIHIASIDRLGRNIIDILTMVEFFNHKSINLFVENIGMFSLIDNKPNPSFKMIVSVLGNVAEMERNNMLERQRQGIELAKAKGTYTGRLFGTKMTNEEILTKYKSVVRELKNGESLRRASKIGGCSLGTAQKIQRIITA